MSRTRLLRRLERLMAQVEALENVIDTRGLEALSDEELEALEAWYEEGEPERWEAWVDAWIASRPPQLIARREPEPVSEVEENLPLTEEPEECPEPVPVPLGSEEAVEGPPVTGPNLVRSCDYQPRSPWAGPPVQRGETEEVAFRSDPLELAHSARALQGLGRSRSRHGGGQETGAHRQSQL